MIEKYAVAINSTGMPEGCAEVAVNFEFSPPAHVPDWIMLLPVGPEITGRDGRTWRLDDPQALVEAFHQGGVDLPIDLEHSTELKGPEGDPAPAVGWIKAVEVRDGAVWGRVDWTNEGKIRVAEREYRYTSPVFVYDKKSKQIVKLTSVGLTNQPNLHLQALNRHQPTEEDIMLKKLLAKLGLAENATEDQALNAIATLQNDLEAARNRAETPSLDKFVPRADYDQALNRASTAEQKLAEVEAEKLETAINSEVDAALKAGKITPATRGFYVAMCRQDGGLEQFRKFVEAAPTVADPSGLDNKDIDEGGKALNAEQQRIADLFGNSAEDLKKYGLA